MRAAVSVDPRSVLSVSRLRGKDRAPPAPFALPRKAMQAIKQRPMTPNSAKRYCELWTSFKKLYLRSAAPSRPIFARWALGAGFASLYIGGRPSRCATGTQHIKYYYVVER